MFECNKTRCVTIGGCHGGIPVPRRGKYMSGEAKEVAGGVSNRAPSQTESTQWFTNPAEGVITAFRYSSAYLAVIAMVQVLLVTTALSLETTLAPAVVGLVTFAVYVGDRIADADTDAATNPERTAFIKRYERVLQHAVSLSYGLAIALAVLGGPVALAITLLPGVFWILYASEWLPSVTSHFRRLKDVLLVNSFVVAFAWALTLTVLPLAFADAPFTPAAAVMFVYFFLGIFVNVEIPNVRDAAGDSEIGVETLPVVLGVHRTRHVLLGVDALTASVLVAAAVTGVLDAMFVGALLLGLAFSLTVTSLVGRTTKEELLTIAAESEYVVVALALVPFAL
ncbi:4-hydroxybenzoate polyprenyltransferase [Haloferax larsenii]|uniref:4-hydroxybenzoate polyprenyltransferase n=2 Tax=Haloferax larsenii TaxID=302484 RepID=A0A1H7GCV3_HALLR|nr:4-hydroxybenzoate polyprenyltransferase [Haloferax larsenii]